MEKHNMETRAFELFLDSVLVSAEICIPDDKQRKLFLNEVTARYKLACEADIKNQRKELEEMKKKLKI